MKTVSISTADRKWLLLNYGGFLQHFALREVLKRLGYTPYRVESGRMLGEVKAFMLPFYNVINNICAVVNPARAMRYNKPFFYWSHRCRFIRDYRRYIGPLFENQRRERVAAIVGGGQAWSIYCQNRPDLYWEDDDCQMKRIAYSVSSAWIALSDNDAWKDRVARACRKADAVSLREKKGVELCSTLLPDKEFLTALDPVFLLTSEEYGKFLSPKRIFKERTILFYMLEVRDSEYLDFRKIDEMSKDLGCKCRIVGIQGAEQYVPLRFRLNPGPMDFLRCCRDAEYIVTNSFHGAVLSMVFKKSFLFVGQRDPKNTGNSNLRQIELLSEFGLMDRSLVIDASKSKMVESLTKRIEWGYVCSEIAKKRERAIEWIRGSLQ